jgi:Leucine-rich repeat (LRR) protein
MWCIILIFFYCINSSNSYELVCKQNCSSHDCEIRNCKSLNFDRRETEPLWRIFAGERDNDFFKLEDNIFVKFDELSWLSLDNCKIHEISERAFNGLKNLTNLHLYKNKIKHLHGRVFSSLENLLLLDLYENQIERISSDIFQPLSKLKELDLSHNQIYSIGQDSFKSLTSIISIKLEGNICVSKEFS